MAEAGLFDGRDAKVHVGHARQLAATHPAVPGRADRTFKRRFAAATGLTPIDEVSWRVGYEDAAFFRRLFRRITDMAPGAYRKRFRIPEFARPG